MEDDVCNLREKLKKTSQEHILSFWDELTDEEKENLREQINKIDFLKMAKLLENSKKDEIFDESEISPLPYKKIFKLEKEELDKYQTIGEEAIKAGKIAVVSMAGGQRN